MRKTMLTALSLIFSLIFTFAAADLSITRCMYYTDESPCDIIWWADTGARQHCRACRNHVTDKEDPRSYVPVTEWASCSVGESGECSVCGATYSTGGSDDPTADEKILMELFMAYTMDRGAAPLTTSVSGSELKLSLTSDFISWVYDMGGSVSETLMVKTEYALSLPAGSTYAYEGSPVTPAAEVTASEYGPGALLEQFGILTIGEPYYENNQTPGKAKTLVDISVKNGQTYTLAVGFTIEESAAAAALPIDEVHFPDREFRDYVLSQIDNDGDCLLSDEEIAQTKSIDTSVAGITGVEYFTALETLTCEGLSQSTLDLSGFENLKKVNISGNLNSLDLSGCGSLEELFCRNNQLTNLNLSGCINLKKLDCKNNQLTSLDVTQCSKLENLSCSSNQLTSLDLSSCNALKSLYCENNKLTALDVSDCSMLMYLDCYDNKLAALDVSGCSVLKSLYCGNNKLTALDVSSCSSLEELNCASNHLTSLDVSACPKLEELHVSCMYSIDYDSNGCFDLSMLPGHFDVSKASNWSNASVTGTTLVVDDDVERIDYDYDAGNGWTVQFTLVTINEQSHVAYCYDPDRCANCGRDNISAWKLRHDFVCTNQGQMHANVCNDCGHEEVERHSSPCYDPLFCFVCDSAVENPEWVDIQHSPSDEYEDLGDMHSYRCDGCNQNILEEHSSINCICGHVFVFTEIPGDVDNSEGVTVDDALAIIGLFTEINMSANYQNADVNNDQQIDIKDVLLILQYVSGWDVTLE